MELTVNNDFLDALHRYNIFQERTGMEGKFENPKNRFKIGDKIYFLKNASIEEYSTFANGQILFTCGAFSSLASNFGLNVRVGRYCEFAPGSSRIGIRHPIESVSINSAIFNFFREHIYSYYNNYEKINKCVLKKVSVPTPQPQKDFIDIGHDVWIGNNVRIKGGIKIGTGCVIGCNSIVTKDIFPYSIVAGNPAKIKKFRFPSEIIHGLLESQWWNYELGDMYNEQLDFSNPKCFLDRFFKIKTNLRLLSLKKFYPFIYLTQKAIYKKIIMHTLFYSDDL